MPLISFSVETYLKISHTTCIIRIPYSTNLKMSSSTPLSTEPSPLSQPNEDSQPLTQSQKNLHRRVVSAQDPKDRALYMIYVDTELGQQARAITDKKARDQFIVAHGTFTGRLPKHAQFFSPVATPRGSDEGQTEEGDLATPNDTATLSTG
ncbi:uncharacterized protein PAC_07874 [Phialocephala subalpina]|uniref:Uncharacterized protein n=1 Tax=Phialocephala subalpina TaxID=576137 RepID=A0A1L7WYZ5_9HELO|nr:uncharacterized protein PAC_07874 [Phialocephala subalpina]